MKQNIQIGVVCIARKTFDYIAAEEIYKKIQDDLKKIENVDWQPSVDFMNQISYGAEEALADGSKVLSNSGTYSNVPTEMIAIVHDPALQYIAVGCIIIFSILFSVGIWRLLKNKKPKL